MSLMIYSGGGYKRYLRKKISKQYSTDVTVLCVPNAIIANEHERGFGVFTDKGDFVPASFQMHRHNKQLVPDINIDGVPYVDKDVVFIGNVKNHFGHFMLEHLNRAWVLCESKYKNMHVVLIDNQSVENVPGYMYKFLELMGVEPERIIILKHTTRFKNVFVPEQAFNLHTFVSEKFPEAFEYMADNLSVVSDVWDKIYMSRDALSVGRTYGERYVQSVFEQNGFHVIYPEQLSLEHQISLMKNCRMLAGCAGTALHMALFMPRGGTVIQIKRNKINKDSATSQYLINKCKNLKSVFVAGAVEKRPSSHSSNVPQIIGLNRYLRKFLDENGFVYDKRMPVVDKEAWREYMTAMKMIQDKYGSPIVNSMKNKFVRITSCFVPGRNNRALYRRWIKQRLRMG